MKGVLARLYGRKPSALDAPDVPLDIVGTAIGIAGPPPLRRCIGEPDLFGRRLETTQVGWADEVAAAASLLMGQAAEGRPLVLVRGLDWQPEPAGSEALIRPKSQDLFR